MNIFLKKAKVVIKEEEKMIRNKNMSNKSKVSIKKATKVDLKSKIHAELDYWAKRIEKSK